MTDCVEDTEAVTVCVGVQEAVGDTLPVTLPVAEDVEVVVAVSDTLGVALTEAQMYDK